MSIYIMKEIIHRGFDMQGQWFKCKQSHKDHICSVRRMICIVYQPHARLYKTMQIKYKTNSLKATPNWLIDWHVYRFESCLLTLLLSFMNMFGSFCPRGYFFPRAASCDAAFLCKRNSPFRTCNFQKSGGDDKTAQRVTWRPFCIPACISAKRSVQDSK